MFRCGAAAAAQEVSAHGSAIGHDAAEFRRTHRIVGELILTDDGDARIGLAQQRTLDLAAQLADQTWQYIVGSHAVEAYGGGTGFFQLPQDWGSVHAREQGAVGLHGEGVHGGTGTLQFGGGKDSLGLLG